jgi:spermidine synthase
MIRSESSIGQGISRLYFLNCIGAVAGCLFAGLFLIAWFGLRLTMLFGAALNMLAAIMAFVIAIRPVGVGAEESAAISEPEEQPSSVLLAVILVGITVSGAVSMMYEVAWIRLLALVLGSSTYSFSLMLATFILGLGIGSFLLSLRRKTSGYGMIFGLTELGVGVCVLVMMPLYIKLPYIFNQMACLLVREPQSFGLYQFFTFLVCAAVMLVPAILQGVTLPAAVKAATPGVKKLGRQIGTIYAVNTLGTLAGALGAGFLGLPRLGIKGTIELAVALNCIVGIAVLFVCRTSSRRPVLVFAFSIAAAALCSYLVAMGPWDTAILSSGMFRSRIRMSSFAKLREAAAKMTMVFYRDGVDATVVVRDSGDKQLRERALVINGKVDASSSNDMVTQKMLAHVPLLIHRNPKKVLVIGLGSGATVGAALAYQSVEKVDVVEISRDVIEAARFFESVNGAYWNDKRVHVFCEDAKTYLQVTPEKYDVIISEPSNPWMAGVAGVFSEEFMAACADRMAPGGIFTQWIQAYELEDRTFLMMIETITSVFPCYTMWAPQHLDTLLVGSTAPYKPDLHEMERRIREPAVQRNLAPIGMSSAYSVLSLQMCDRAMRPSHVSWLGVTHSDYFPFLEYVAPRGFFLGRMPGTVKWFEDRQRSPANARLWLMQLQELAGISPDAAAECYRLTKRYPNSVTPVDMIWARKWLSLSPDDPDARVAMDSLSEGGSGLSKLIAREDAAGTEDYQAAKLHCSRLMTEYRVVRNCLETAAQPCLAVIISVMERHSSEVDPKMLMWRGELEYDSGNYRAAQESLGKALTIMPDNAQSSGDRIETILLLCDALRAEGKTGEALSLIAGMPPTDSNDIRVHLRAAELVAEMPAGSGKQ